MEDRFPFIPFTSVREIDAKQYRLVMQTIE